jgi:hypothetical protein
MLSVTCCYIALDDNINSFAALRTSDTLTIDTKTMQQNVSFQGKNCVRYKLQQEEI